MSSHDDGHLAASLEDPTRFNNRELSWLEFNSRVLSQASDPNHSLLERLRFCAIYAANLDEFFMVRVAGLKDQVAAGVSVTPPDGLSPSRQLDDIGQIVSRQALHLERIHIDRLQPELAERGVKIVDWGDLDAADQVAARAEFEKRVFPVLTPLALDPGHPFPYISSLSLNLAVMVANPGSESRHFARVKVPPMVDRFFKVPSGSWLPIEQLIAAHLDALFPGMDIIGSWPFRVTRNADLSLDDEEADDLLEAVEVELRRRRFGRAIRLEVDLTMPKETLELLVRELDLDQDDVSEYRGLLDCSGFFQLADLPISGVGRRVFRGIVPHRLNRLRGSDHLFARLRRGDVFLHHPYDSFISSVAEFVLQAAIDPDVQAIKLTLYRTSGDSAIVKSLIRAAESGKQVAVLVELKARFDEQANIGWARQLEEAGVHVVYGLIGFKIHSKVTLVVRSEPDGLRRYCHIGTGNYNPKTARHYEDVGLLTASPDIAEDLTQLFNFLTGYGRKLTYQRFLVAPHRMRAQLSEMIRAEQAAGPQKGRIILKMNSLVDARLINDLYAASNAGVQIDLVVRGICCLRPGVPGLSENIRVRSIVGRYLEHSRILYFANGDGEAKPAYFIGSADFMPRNLDRRVEAMVSVRGEEAQSRLRQILDVCLADDTSAWTINADGSSTRASGGTLSAHNRFEELALARTAAPDL